MGNATSDRHDELSEQDGYRRPDPGHRSDFAPPRPGFSISSDGTLAPAVQAKVGQGWKRAYVLMAEGSQPARGAAANKYGFITGESLTEYGAGSGEGAKYAVIYRPDRTGLEIWQVGLVSEDAFQRYARKGTESGLIDDAKSGGGFFGEDRRNVQGSVAMYQRVGVVPRAKVYDAWKAGLVQDDLAKPYFADSPTWQAEERKRLADEAERVKAERAARPKAPPRPIKPREFSVIDGNTVVVATSAEDSSDPASFPEDFREVSDGKAPGALSLPGPFVGLQEDGTWAPAREEIESVMDFARRGDPKAMEALRVAGIA